MLEQRNLILAIVFSVAILILWQFVFLPPHQPQPTPQEQAGVEAPAGQVPGDMRVPAVPGGPGEAPADETRILDRSAVIAATPRIEIDTPTLAGSLSLRGARIDDLTLKDYRVSVDPQSSLVTLLSPSGTRSPYFAEFGWTAADGADVPLPDADTVWASEDEALAPGQPVTMTWDNGQGLRFIRTISVDEHYMFTVADRVENASGEDVTLYPFGVIARHGKPETLDFFILHEGALGVFDEVLDQQDYDDIADEGRIVKTPETSGGWIGITDKYWLTALVPNQDATLSYSYNHWTTDARDDFQVDFSRREGLRVAAGGDVEVTNRLFAGAKVVRVLDDYKEDLGIPRFDRAVDFGLLFFLTKPMFLLLRVLSETIGNFGIAILLVTVIVKVIFFPLANRSYRAMSKMKKLTPEMNKIRERFKDDRQRQQQEIMALYRKEGANPVSGCLPILLQIPVFFALYKVLFVTIEMRHTPFFGWIQDLSAPDPLNLFTGFGLIPWTPPEFIPVIGIWPILMGISMWLQQRLNPQQMDKMQQRIFMLLPIVFTFILAPFPAGLVIYWTWNNVLSIAQQWTIMRQSGIRNPAAAE